MDLALFDIDSPLYNSKKNSFRFYGLWYSKWPAWAHDFNAKIGFEKYAPGPKIFIKMCQHLGRQTKPAYFEMFWPISQDPLHIFQNRFLRWTRELKPVILSTINLINGTNFFSSYKGGFLYQRGPGPWLPTTKQFNSFCNVFIWPNVTRKRPGTIFLKSLCA